MEWQDQGVLLTVRRHGESSAIVEVLTEYHGRHAGLIRGGGSKKVAAMLQPGTQLALTWRARLEDQLGTFTVEQLLSRSAMLLSDRNKLYAFNALVSMLTKYLPEREPNENLYSGCIDLLARFQLNDFWQHRYCIFELQLLEELGYGIDLSECAVTAQPSDLAYVSPKSGRAVSRGAAMGWEAKLLAFPAFLKDAELRDIPPNEFKESLALTGHFFKSRFPDGKQELPEARMRFAEMVQR